MKHIGTGMRPGSLAEVALFLAGLFALFLIYKVYYQRIQRGWLNRRRAFADKKFSETARLLGILPSDQELLLELAGYLPEPEQQKHLLFTDPVLFDVSRRDYLADHPQHVERLLALRVKLAHPSKGSGRALHSTTELPAGTLLFAAPPETGTIKKSSAARSEEIEEAPPLYRIRDILPDAMLVEFLQARPQLDRKPKLEIQRPDGRYRFTTSILETGEDFARLQHSYHLERRQKRRYVRRDVSLEGRINRQPARIVNLGGGGARLHASQSILGDIQANAIVKLSFVLEGARQQIETTARVVQVKPEHHLLRCEFIRIRESDRDRVVKFVLTPVDDPAESNSTATSAPKTVSDPS